MKQELCATVGKTQTTVVVEPLEDGKFRIAIDGRERVIDGRPVRPGTWSLLVDGASWVVDVEERKGGELVVLARGSESALRLEDARRKRMAEAVLRGGHPAAGGEVVRAPIAGKVVKLLIAPGQRVAAGDPVIVLEAMKMENEIRAVRGGTLKEGHVAPGKLVEANEALLTLE